MRRTSRVVAAALAVVLIGGTMGGCASEEPAGQAVPALAERLDEIDSAIQDGNLELAGEAVQELIAEATRAREDGRLDPDDAAEVVRAAETLLRELESAGEQAPVETTPAVPDPDATEGDDEGGGGEDEEKKDEENKDDDRKDDDKKDDDGDDDGDGKAGGGGGNGPSSGNGPDDGHGN